MAARSLIQFPVRTAILCGLIFQLLLSLVPIKLLPPTKCVLSARFVSRKEAAHQTLYRMSFAEESWPATVTLAQTSTRRADYPVLGVSSSPGEELTSRTLDEERPPTASTQHSTSSTAENQWPVRLPEPSSTRPIIIQQQKSPVSSQPSSPTLRPVQRTDTLSPRFGGEVQVFVITSFRDRTVKEHLDFPRGESVVKTYEFIEGFSKRTREDLDSGEELYLSDGFCQIICAEHDSRVNDHCSLPEQHPLMNQRDWSDIETVVQNYEKGSAGHRHLVVEITRKLEIGNKKMELPPPEQSLRETLYFHLNERMVKLAGGRLLRYLPNDEKESFTTEEIVGRLVDEEAKDLGVGFNSLDDIAEKLRHHAPILLIIFLYSRLELRFLKVLLDRGYSDKSLPLLEDNPSWLSKDGNYNDIRNINCYTTLRRDQWPFQAVVFNSFDDHKSLEPDAIVPFRYKEERARGAFSTVFKVLLEDSHQRLYHLPGNRNPALALKAINSHRNTASAASANERLLLRGLRALDHAHIIKLLGSYEQEGSHYFLFPLAECNLEEYMRTDPDGFDDPHSLKSRQLTLWMISQFAGIASGLAKIHVSSTESDGNKPTTTEFLDPNVAKEKRPAGSTGYHHDIKPPNLLYFKTVDDTIRPCPPLGVLQIADFGIGKFHSLQSGTGTKTFRGTPTYAAPESKIAHQTSTSSVEGTPPQLKLSRPYDVWSLGCVLMEVLVWMVYGTEGWKKFNTERFGPVEENDPFYTDGFFYLSEAREPQVRKVVQKWMKKLQQHPRLNDKGGSLAGLRELIEDRVLVCNPIHRLKADELTDELKILEKIARSEENDCLAPIKEVPSHEEQLSTPSTPTIILESTHFEPATAPDSGSGTAEQGNSILKESMKEQRDAQKPPPVEQGLVGGNIRSSMVIPKPPSQQASGSSSSTHVAYAAPSPPRHSYKSPSRSSTMKTIRPESAGSERSTTVEPTTTRQNEGDEEN